MSIWIEGRVVRQVAWTKGLYSLFIEAPIEPFIAGQFCRIALDIDEKRVPRPYSFVNAPHEPLHEFYYSHVPEGMLTEKLVALKENDPIWVARKGAGLFTLKQVADAPTLWLFATGTALGVFLSILKTQEPWQRFKRIVLVHAARFPNELTHQDVIASFKEAHSNFMYLPFATREEASGVFKGRITEAFESGILEQAAGCDITPDGSTTMICGNPHMVKAMVEALKERGLTSSTPREPGQITIENYWKD